MTLPETVAAKGLRHEFENRFRHHVAVTRLSPRPLVDDLERPAAEVVGRVERCRPPPCEGRDRREHDFSEREVVRLQLRNPLAEKFYKDETPIHCRAGMA